VREEGLLGLSAIREEKRGGLAAPLVPMMKREKAVFGGRRRRKEKKSLEAGERTGKRGEPRGMNYLRKGREIIPARGRALKGGVRRFNSVNTGREKKGKKEVRNHLPNGAGKKTLARMILRKDSIQPPSTEKGKEKD